MKIRSTVFIVLLALIVVSCSPRKAVHDTGNLNATSDTVPSVLASYVAKAIIENDFIILDNYLPNITIARFLLSGKPDTLSDYDVQATLLDPLRQRLHSSLLVIEDDIENLGLDRAGLSYNSLRYFSTDESPLVPRVLEVVLDYQGEEVVIPTTVLNIHDKWYLFEILNSYGRFKNI